MISTIKTIHAVHSDSMYMYRRMHAKLVWLCVIKLFIDIRCIQRDIMKWYRQR